MEREQALLCTSQSNLLEKGSGGGGGGRGGGRERVEEVLSVRVEVAVDSLGTMHALGLDPVEATALVKSEDLVATEKGSVEFCWSPLLILT